MYARAIHGRTESQILPRGVIDDNLGHAIIAVAHPERGPHAHIARRVAICYHCIIRCGRDRNDKLALAGKVANLCGGGLNHTNAMVVTIRNIHYSRLVNG